MKMPGTRFVAGHSGGAMNRAGSIRALLIAAEQMSCRDEKKQPQILRLRAASRRFAQDDKNLYLERFAQDDTTFFGEELIAPGGCFFGARLVVAVLLLSLFSLPSCAAQAAGEKPAYLDSTLPVSVRVDDLMKRMTLKEKIGQLNLPCVYVDELGKTVDEKTEGVRKFAAGNYTGEIGPGAGFFTLADT